MIRSLCMEVNRTEKLSSKPQSRLIISQHKKSMVVKGRITNIKERARRIVKLPLDIAEIEHSFNTKGNCGNLRLIFPELRLL